MVKRRRGRHVPLAADGYAMVALLVALSVMSIMMTVALPAWHTAARREKEAELVFRGEQYARALALFSRKFANQAPPNVDILISEKMLRKKYKDPITGGDFELITPGTPLPGLTAPPGQRPSTTPATGRSASGGGSASSLSSQTSLVSQLGRNTQSGARGGAARPQANDFEQRAQASRGSTTLTVGGATAGIMGVRSKSTDKSFRVYNGAEHYNEWIFVARQSGAAGTGAQGGAAGQQGSSQRGGQAGRGRGGAGNTLTPARGGSQFGPRGGGQPAPPPPPPPGARGRLF